MTDTTTAEIAATPLVDTYFEMWRATDDATRRALLEQVFAPDGRHVDALADANGYDELASMIANVHGHYPGFTIERTSGVDRYGQQLRFGWKLDAADGTPVVAGIDVGELDADGRLTRIAGFWGDLPARDQ
ncbi:MAG TPA: nuclear transport factor 2 family protein [Acidimicrobiia bacterium]|jgi:hypothetical protein|nr:nuclear transport factor 2 family protein [Acidimicrobiia bacterium]